MTAPTGATPTPLSASVAALTAHIFDVTDLAATAMTPTLQARCLAVIVLAHAEIEEAIEEACQSAVADIERHARPDFHFLAWGLATANPKALNDSAIKKQMAARSAISYLATDYLAMVSRSHGIKKKNLTLLLLPLGVSLHSLQADIDNLDSFGKTRGKAAHLSPLKAQMVELPSAVRTRVVNAAISADAVIAAIAAAAQAVASNVPLQSPRVTIRERFLRLFGRR